MRRFFMYLGIISLILIAWDAVYFTPHDERESFSLKEKTVTLFVNGQELLFPDVEEETVGAFLGKRGYPAKEAEVIFPGRSEKLYPGMTIWFEPAREIRLKVDGRDEIFLTSEKTAGEILAKKEITLDEDDIVKPLREATVPAGETLSVTRVEIREETKDIAIDFSTKTIEDDKLSWRTKEVRQKGKKGTKRTVYRVSYHDGKEVNRKTVRTETLEPPTEEVIVQGTLVKTGKSHKGAASWYAWTGTMAAANPWLPKGSYVKVTNVDNGKSVIVVINDRGPFVPGRIIDLDKVAFEKIASLGAGVINVKMEEIIN